MSTNPGSANSSASTSAQEFACTGPIAAIVRIGGGALTVAAIEQSVATVSVVPYDGSDASRTAAQSTRVEFNGDRLRVETSDTGGGWIFRRGGRVRVDLRLPGGSRLRANTGSADVHAQGPLNDVVVHSGSGDVYAARTGDLSVETGSGDVHADDVGGGLRVHTGSGDVSATRVSGEVNVRVASGDIEIEEAAGAVRVMTASGDIRVGSTQRGQVKLNSVSGDITVGVVSGTRVWLDLSTVSGSTSNDLDMTGAPGAVAASVDASAEGDPATGKAQLSLHVHTVSGDIRVHRVSPAHA